MEQPDSPSIKPSEPELQKRAIEEGADRVSNGEGIAQINPIAALDFLRANGLDLDDDGFIINPDTGEYAEPYGYSPQLFRGIDSPVENPFTEYFMSTRNDGIEHYRLPNKECLHLTDLHSITFDEDGGAHPVPDNTLNIVSFRGEVGLAFSNITAWSNLFTTVEEEEVQDAVRVVIGAELNNKTVLNCSNPDCECSAPADEWDGSPSEPECPDCGGPWTEILTYCSRCGGQHWGTTLNSDDIHAEPICPDCNASMEALKRYTRYDHLH